MVSFWDSAQKTNCVGPLQQSRAMQYEAHFENIVKCNQQMIKLSKQFENLTENNDALKFGSDLIQL